MRAFVILLIIFFLNIGCERVVEDFQTETIDEYFPLQVGKYRTYRTDSTVFTNFGSRTEVHSYQEKHVIDAEITDAGGRPSFRVLRYIRDANATTEAWKSAGSYFITKTSNTVEVTENNLRFVKLVSPVKTEYSWKGNTHLSSEPYTPAFKYELIKDIDQWAYQYTTTGETVTFFGKTYNDVITVLAVDESFNVLIVTPSQFGYNKYAIEKYAKNIGMVYQEVALWEYQPNTKYIGFGIKRSLIDYN